MTIPTFNAEQVWASLHIAIRLDNGMKALRNTFDHYVDLRMQEFKDPAEQKSLRLRVNLLRELYPSIRDYEHSKDPGGKLKASVAELLANIYGCVIERWRSSSDNEEKREIEAFLMKYRGKAPHDDNGQFLEAMQDQTHSVPDLLAFFSRHAIEGISFERHLPKGYPRSGIGDIVATIFERLSFDQQSDGIHLLEPWIQLMNNRGALQTRRAIFRSMYQLVRDAANQAAELDAYCKQLEHYGLYYDLFVMDLDMLIIHIQHDTKVCPQEVKDMVVGWHKESNEFSKFVIQIVTKKAGQPAEDHERVEIGD